MTSEALTWGSHGDPCTVEEAVERMGFKDDALRGQTLRTYKAETAKQQRILDGAISFAKGDTARRGLLMVGPPGRGKTHVARGIAVSLVKQGRGFRYKRIQDVVAECKQRMSPASTESPEQHVRWYCDFPDLLIIDELGRTRGGEWDIDQVIYPLVDSRKGKPTIWVTNYSLSALADKYDEAITSRLQLCTTMVFDGMEDWRAR